MWLRIRFIPVRLSSWSTGAYPGGLWGLGPPGHYRGAKKKKKERKEKKKRGKKKERREKRKEKINQHDE